MHIRRPALIPLILFAVSIGLWISSAGAGDLDLSTPEGSLEGFRKIQCSTVDGKPVYYWWRGSAYSRRMGEADRHLFNVEGMNVRQCGTLDDGKRGKGMRMVSREILLYTDPKSGEPLEEWANPWTGETVKVLQVENDPVNQRPMYPLDDSGKPAMRWFGTQLEGDWWITSTIPLFYDNVLGGEYQKQVGPVYHATEMFNFMGDLESLLSDDRDSAAVQVGWVRFSDWLPWMEMQGREGIIYFHTAGKKVQGYDSISSVMRNYIETHAEKYRNPPPLDDDRPNETSWTYFQKMVPGEKLPRGGAN
jgi:hypothetical protein